MNDKILENLTKAVTERFAEQLKSCETALSELTIEVAAADYLSVCTALRDEPAFKFEQLSDLCGVDYLSYGEDEWSTQAVSTSGFSRGVDVGESSTGRMMFGDEHQNDKGRLRYAVVTHLLSYTHNQRIRVRCYAENNEMPVVASVTSLWSSADWYEREAFDLFGILFTGHDDLRRLLCDYGFVGHAFRKDFPMVGNVEMRYDPEQQRVVYQPVSIKPRVLVPRVIRDDHRYLNPQKSESGDA